MNSSQFVKSLLAGAAISVAASTANAADPAGFSLVSPDQATAQEIARTPLNGPDHLRHIAVDSGEMFFAGESGKHEYPFFALPAEVAAPATLILNMQTAISAAPERSTMHVYVNDVDVGTVELRSGDPRQIKLPVASGVVQPGYNSVSILVDQKHRVDCSIDATYELWTQIDPEKSGFVFSNSAAPAKGTLADLVAQGRGNDGRASLVAHVLPGASTTDIDRTMSVIQALTILGDFDKPTVTFDPNATGAGIDIYVGTYGTIRELLNVDAASSDVVDGMNIDVTDAARSRLIISARTADELDGHIKQFASQLPDREMTGTTQGLRALANAKGQMLQPETRVALTDLGFISKPFTGRLYRETINFSMPSDFYPADYASLGVNLSAQYAAGLSKDAVLIVKANGQIVSNIQLGDGQTGIIKNQRLPIPLSKLRPGENSLTFEAQLPMPSDASCDPVASIQEPPRFLIMDATYLDMPSYARVGRYPDLAALVSGAEFAGKDAATKPLSVFVPKLDRELMDAAGSFVAKMAYSSGQVMDVRTTATQPDGATTPLLAFATYATLPQSIQSEMKLDLNNIAVQAFKPVGSPIGKNLDHPQELIAPAGISGHFDELLKSSKETVASAINWAKPTGQMHFAGWSFGSADKLQDQEKVYRPLPGSDLLIAQRETTQGGVWTVVASPSTEVMSNGMAALSQRATWKRLNGATQAFTQTGALIDEQTASTETLYQTQPFTFTNLRLLTAGWFANNSVEYTVAQIVAALVLGMSTFFMLKVGRRS